MWIQSQIKRIDVLFSNGLAYGIMKVLGRFSLLRNIVRKMRNKKAMTSLVDNGWAVHDSDELINELVRDGYSLRLSIDADKIKKLIEYAENNDACAYMDPSLKFSIKNKEEFEKKLGKEILIAHYPNLNSTDLFNSIEDSKVLSSIAERYCGEGAFCIASQMWWTFPAKVEEDLRKKFAHFYHRDLDGYNFMKFFIYLTDVEPGDGGHFFVSGSHRPSLRDSVSEGFRIDRIDDSVIHKRYDMRNIVEMVGPAGTVIVEDTFGLHKGQTPSRNARLMACFVFGTKNYNNVQRFLV